MADIGLWFQQGTALTLAAILNKTAPEDTDLCLFSNDYTPGIGTTEANLTEATFAGYVAKALTAGSWTVTPGAPSTAVYGTQTFTCISNSQNEHIYGWYIRQRSSGKALCGGRFSATDYIDATADFTTVTPTLPAQ